MYISNVTYIKQPPLNKNRLNLIKMAFDKLDKTSDGQITVNIYVFILYAS